MATSAAIIPIEQGRARLDGMTKARVPYELARRVQILADREGLPVAAIVRRALQAYLRSLAPDLEPSLGEALVNIQSDFDEMRRKLGLDPTPGEAS